MQGVDNALSKGRKGHARSIHESAGCNGSRVGSSQLRTKVNGFDYVIVRGGLRALLDFNA